MHTARHKQLKSPAQALLSPFRIAPCVVASILAATPLWWMAMKGTQQWVFGLGAALVGSLFLLALLASSASGQRNISVIALIQDLDKTLPQLALITGAIALGYFIYTFNQPYWLMIYGAVLIFCLPAMLLVAISNEWPIDIINPIRITECILEHRHFYFLLLACCYGCVLGLYWLFEASLDYMPLVASIHWLLWASMLLLMLFFQSLGYILFREPHQPSPAEKAALNHTEHPTVAKAKHHIQESEYEQALSLIEHALKDEPYNIEINDLFHKLCILANKPAKCMHHAHQYLKFLLQRNFHAKALDIFMDIYRQDASYKPDTMGEAIKIASILNEVHKYKVLVALLDGLHKKFPNDPLIPKAYGFLAKVLFEKHGKDKQAKDILEFILVQYPDTPLKPAIKKQLDAILAKHHASDKDKDLQ